MRFRHAVPAGIADAAFASLAALAMGIYAARDFTAGELGIYALFFSSFVMATLLSKQLVFVPAEVESIGYDGTRRLGILGQSLRLGFLPVITAALLGTLLASSVAPSGDRSHVTALAVTMAIAAAISPAQDHVRRLLHIANMSWHAAAVSIVQFGGVVGAIMLQVWVGVDHAWIPFGSLAIANALSISFGLVVVWRVWNGPADRRVTFRGLAKSGSWLVVVGLVPAATGFIAAAIVVHVAGATTMGHAEAARIISRPILVIGVGLGAALRPRSMEAALRGQEAAAKLVRRVFGFATVSAGLLYAAYASVDWRWNVFAEIVPNAYSVSGLVAVSILAATGEGVTRPYNFELTAARRESKLARIEALGNTVRGAVVASSADAVGAFALPAGLLALGAIRWYGFRRAVVDVYQTVSRSSGALPDDQGAGYPEL